METGTEQPKKQASEAELKKNVEILPKKEMGETESNEYDTMEAENIIKEDAVKMATIRENISTINTSQESTTETSALKTNETKNYPTNALQRFTLRMEAINKGIENAIRNLFKS